MDLVDRMELVDNMEPVDNMDLVGYGPDRLWTWCTVST